MPATKKHPIHKVDTVIGGKTFGNQSPELEFSIYQPQILRILKTLEIIGFYNEFKEGALIDIYKYKMDDEESAAYIDNYLNWRSLEGNHKEAEQAKYYRDLMREKENQVTD